MLSEKIILNVEGMSCNHCVNSVKKAVGAIDGVSSVDVNLDDKTVTIEYDLHKVKIEDIKLAIEDEGYTVK
ncbi:MAG: copper ion binding protein [Clostridia bacterium]|jgi:copper chaperone|nr:copper ion binding protein [Clostridia bacterium]